MMPLDKETFSYWVTHPEDLTSVDFQQLQESLVTYPYCQSLYTLTAKAAAIHQKGQNAPFVRRAAAHALSRNALRKLIENEFQWSDNLLLKLNELASRQVPIPDDYQHESYALYRNKPAGASGWQIPLIQMPRIAFNESGMVVDTSFRPPVDDPTLAEEAIQADLALDGQQAQEEETQLQQQRLLDQARRREQELIETFIRKEPNIAPMRGKLNDPAQQEDLSQRSQPSTLGSNGLVTESFAKILCRQGKYDKAIEIYEKLALKNPEKSAYFADKISELKASSKVEQPVSNR